MLRWIYDKFEEYVEATITGRILKFYDAMAERGEIVKRPAKGPQAIGIQEASGSIRNRAQ